MKKYIKKHLLLLYRTRNASSLNYPLTLKRLQFQFQQPPNQTRPVPPKPPRGRFTRRKKVAYLPRTGTGRVSWNTSFTQNDKPRLVSWRRQCRPWGGEYYLDARLFCSKTTFHQSTVRSISIRRRFLHDVVCVCHERGWLAYFCFCFLVWQGYAGRDGFICKSAGGWAVNKSKLLQVGRSKHTMLAQVNISKKH